MQLKCIGVLSDKSRNLGSGIDILGDNTDDSSMKLRDQTEHDRYESVEICKIYSEDPSLMSCLREKAQTDRSGKYGQWIKIKNKTTAEWSAGCTSYSARTQAKAVRTNANGPQVHVCMYGPTYSKGMDQPVLHVVS